MNPHDGNIFGNAPRPPWARSALILGVLLLASLASLDRDLWTPDEPREAGISREMWLSPGIVPSLNGRPFIEKPPLYYWTVAGAFELGGGPSPAAARSVSAIASFLTLLLVFLWGRREVSETAGLLAALGLATSTQFMVSSHWVLIDPLLMLCMTVVCWSGWELISRGEIRSAILFYIALVLALWTKGLVGPVLIAAGLLVYLLCKRSLRPILAFFPLAGMLVLGAATALFAFLIYRDAGYEVLREWFWVNHVLRFTSPAQTGHEQPFYYYLGTLAVAIMPWWVPFFDVLRRRRWRSDELANLPLRIYLASICLGMLLLLSASTTKREIYLLPLLPPLALLLAIHAATWLERPWRQARRLWPWWLQLGLVTAFCTLPVAAVMVFFQQVSLAAIGYLLLLMLVVTLVVVYSRLRHRQQAVQSLISLALLGIVGLQMVVVQLAAPHKGMTPFIQWIDSQVTADQAIFALGDIDETFNGIMPFVTGRRVVELATVDIARVKPDYIVLQDKNGGRTAAKIPAEYEMLGERDFAGRYLALWQRRVP